MSGARPDRRKLRGALVLLAGALLIALAWLRPNPFADPYEVRALFADAGGVANIGAEVRIAGTESGKVTSRERQGDLAVVTMELDVPEGTVRTDATAELRPRLLFEGTSYLDLDPGSPGAAPLGDSAIPVAQTRSAVSVTDALGVLDQPTREALQTTVDELDAGAEPEAFNRALGDLPSTVEDAGTIVSAARGEGAGGEPDQLRRAVAGFSRTARAFASRRDDLVPLAAGLERTAAAAARPRLDAALAGLPETLGDVRTGGAAATRALDALDPLARELVPGAQRLQPTLAAVRPVARAAAPVFEETVPLAIDARATLRAAAASAPGARDVLDAVDPLLATLDGGLLDALEKRTIIGTPAYLAFLGLFAGGGGASRPFEPGQGHFMRFGFRFLTGAGRPAPPCTLIESVSAPLAETLAQSGGCQR